MMEITPILKIYRFSIKATKLLTLKAKFWARYNLCLIEWLEA